MGDSAGDRACWGGVCGSLALEAQGGAAVAVEELAGDELGEVGDQGPG